MVLFDEWHLELLVPPDLPDDVAERLRDDFDAAVHQVADDLTARFRRTHLDHLRVQASQ